VTHIDGKLVDPLKWYDIATSQLLLEGMDNVEPLKEFAKQFPDRIPSEDQFMPAKTIVVDQYAANFWAANSPRLSHMNSPSEVSTELEKLDLTERNDFLSRRVVEVWRRAAKSPASPKKPKALLSGSIGGALGGHPR
jgi:hypothetical protein